MSKDYCQQLSLATGHPFDGLVAVAAFSDTYTGTWLELEASQCTKQWLLRTRGLSHRVTWALLFCNMGWSVQKFNLSDVQGFASLSRSFLIAVK